VSARPKASRMERNVKNLGAAALIVGIALLAVITGMTARYGWTHTPGGWEDKLSQAAINGVIDLAGAVAAGMWGAFFAMRFRLAGLAVTVLALSCALYTYQAVVGFQSSSKESLVANRERANNMSAAYLDWAKTVTTKAIESDKDKKGRPNNESLVTGIEAVGAQVTKQMQILQAGEVATAADGQSTTFARLLGVKEADARSYSVTVTSALIVFIHYLSLWAYGFIRQRLEPAVISLNHGPLASDNSRHFPDTVRKVSKTEAKTDIQALVTANVELCNEELAERWGVSPSEASKWQSDFARAGLMRRVQRGRRKVAVAPLRTINGNGATHIGNA
jgi:hypothetical protein